MGTQRYDVNLFDPALVEDPFPLYEEIRAAGRVVWNDAVQAWMVTGFRGLLGRPHRYGPLPGDER